MERIRLQRWDYRYGHKPLAPQERMARWHGWRLNPKYLTLDYYDPHGRWRYQIDLERCTTCAEILDWILQLSKKRWLPAEGLQGFINAINDLLNPQGTLCSFGVDKGRLTKEHLDMLIDGFLKGKR